MSGKACPPFQPCSLPQWVQQKYLTKNRSWTDSFSFHRLLLLHFNVTTTGSFFWKPVEGANSKDTTLKIRGKKKNLLLCYKHNYILMSMLFFVLFSVKLDSSDTKPVIWSKMNSRWIAPVCYFSSIQNNFNLFLLKIVAYKDAFDGLAQGCKYINTYLCFKMKTTKSLNISNCNSYSDAAVYGIWNSGLHQNYPIILEFY